MGAPPRLAVVATHPVQYYAPWFSHIVRETRINLRVYYLWDFGVANRFDPGFRATLAWDLPLLEGHSHEFVPNLSPRPGTSGFLGLWNPSLGARLRDWKPDAILLTAYNFASFAALIAGRGEREPPLLFRGDSHRLVRRGGMLEPVKRSLISMVFGRFDAVLYVGEANREYFRLHGVSEEKLFRSPHAVDNARFFGMREQARSEAAAWRAQLGIPPEHRVVLFAGKFESKKRPRDLLQAFAGAALERTSLLFVGSGEEEGALREEARSRPDVYVASFRNQTEMPATYAAGDVLVLPSYGPAETWGLAVNEAMCMGLPAIVSDHVGCARDLVVPGETGLVFRAGDVAGLRDVLRAALADPARLATWGANARERIRGYDYAAATEGLTRAIVHLGVA